MDFSGPEPADFANVAALNLAFLDRLRSRTAGRRLRNSIPAPLGEAALCLSDRQARRLSAAPFLLLSLREHDAETWDRLGVHDPAGDLFTAADDSNPDLAVAAVSFIWQLARRNPYAARLVCGASPAWCEQIGEYTLLRLLQSVGACPHILGPRFADNAACWRKLLGPGLSADAGVRESAYLACLQTLLTDRLDEPARRLQTAACRRSTPAASITNAKRVT
jgi:hypothetical protein